MTSEIRANTIKNRVGLGTIEYSNTGPVISGVTTAFNFKTGTSNLHSTGLNIFDLDVDGHTNLDNVSIAGVTTIAHTGANQLIIKDSDTAGDNAHMRISFQDSGGTEKFFVGNNNSNGWLYLGSPSGQNNNIAFRVNGNDKFQVNGNGAYVVGNLTVSGNADISDSIIHTGDTNTKIRFPGNDAISFETAGDQRLRIYDDGYVIIGSTSRSGTAGAGGLDIQGNSTNCILEMGNPFPNFSGAVVPEFRITATNSGHTVEFESVYGGDNLLHKHLSFAGGVTSIHKGINDDEVARFTSNGKVLIGSSNHNTAIASGVGSQLQIEGNSYSTSSFTLINNQNSTDPAFINFGKSRAGESGGNTIVQNGDRLGGIRWAGADGTDLHSRAASIDVIVNGTPAGNNMPGMMSFSTSPAGTHAPVDRLNIDAAGRITLGAGTQGQYASSFNSGANQLVITSNGSTGLTIDSTSSTSSSIHFADGSTGGESYRGIIEYQHSVDDMKFAVEAQHVARLRKGSYSDVGGGMIIGNSADASDSAHSDSRTLILGATTHGETGMTLLNSTSGSGKIRFSDGVQYYNQGAIGYYHGTRTVGQIPNYPESLSFAAAQKENNFVLNGNEAMRLASGADRQKVVDGFWEKNLTTTYQTVFTIRSGYSDNNPHMGYFYEIIVYGGDWGSHSANRTYFKGFINGYSGYGGHSAIEHSGPYGANSGGGGSISSSECQIQVGYGSGSDVTLSEIQMRLSTGSGTAQGYARFIGYVRDYSGFILR